VISQAVLRYLYEFTALEPENRKNYYDKHNANNVVILFWPFYLFYYSDILNIFYCQDCFIVSVKETS